jgi:hypothetical protein
MARALEHLGVAQLRQLTLALLGQTVRSGNADRERLADAIHTHAARSARPKAYYRQVLHRLASGGLLDLEIIDAHPEVAGSAPTPGTAAGERMPAPLPAAATRRDPSAPRAEPKTVLPPWAEGRGSRQDRQLGAEAGGEGFWIGNAGMVLAVPYLPRLFDRLGLVQGRDFGTTAARERAVHLLQYLVHGALVDDRTESPESELLLNKLVCGLDPTAPVCLGIEVQAHEAQTIDGLLAALIGHWSTLGSTSVAGLRESFLAREGTLKRRREDWYLSVHPGPFDMLLDRLPWSYTPVRLSWMQELIHVAWR